MNDRDRELYNFLKKAGAATYAGGGLYEKEPERSGFYELVYEEGNYHYRDSYTGHFRSWGSELVRLDEKPVWNTLYGGGMVKGQESLTRDTFKFLKTCFKHSDNRKMLFRGPEYLRLGDWRYYYEQVGDIEEFHGYERILHGKTTVFTHRIIGGKIISKK